MAVGVPALSLTRRMNCSARALASAEALASVPAAALPSAAGFAASDLACLVGSAAQTDQTNPTAQAHPKRTATMGRRRDITESLRRTTRRRDRSRIDLI